MQLRTIRDAKETDRVICPGPQQLMSWNQVKRVIRTWRDRKAEMIVFRLTLSFIVPSGQEVKAGELDIAEFGLCRQHDAGFNCGQFLKSQCVAVDQWLLCVSGWAGSSC